MDTTSRERDVIEQLDRMEAAARAQQEAIARCRAQILAHDHKAAKETGKAIADTAKANYAINYQFERDIRSIDAGDSWGSVGG